MKTKKILVEVIATTMIVAPLAQPARVFNVHALDTTPVVQTTETTPELQDATVIIPSGATIEQVKDIIGKAVIKNYESVDLQSIEWEYECVGKNGGLSNTAWGSIEGFKSTKKVLFKNTDFTHPSLAANEDGTYNLRIKGSDQTVQLTKKAKLSSDITLKDNVSITLPYKDADTIDYDALREAIFNQVVESTTPDLKLEDVTIQYKVTVGWSALEGEGFGKPAMTAGTHEIKVSYAGNDTYYGEEVTTSVTFNDRAEAEIEVNAGQTVKLPYNEDATVDYNALKKDIFNKVVESSNPTLTADDVTIKYYASKTTLGFTTNKWAALEGEKIAGVDYPAISEGEQKIQITYAGDKDHIAKTVETTINVVDREESTITVNENASAKLVYNDDLTVDYNKVKEEIFKNVVKESNPELTADDVTIKYQAPKTTLGLAVPKYVDLAGEKGSVTEYPAISEGEQQIQITYAGNKDYKPVTVKTTINVVDRATVTVNTNEGPYNVSMAFNDDQSYDYEGTAKAIYKAVVASTDPELSYKDFKVEYNPDPTGTLKVWYSLDNKDSINLNRFGAGTWKIRLSWNGTKEYKPGDIIVEVNVQDNRLESNVAIKEGTSITYNMDANEMKKALFNAIDFDNSTLPAKEELSVDDFTYEYYGENVLAGNISGGVKQWAPIEGGEVNLLDYPQMPAGEQKIKVTYKGNKNYRPSTNAETTITVKKAKVSVKVHSTNIFADEKVPEGFITTNPADKFDVYTVYAGATSNVSTGLYLDLPARYMNSSVLKILDPVVEKIAGKTFTQMMQDGVTVGELRKLLSTQDLLDLLEKLHIDTGTFGQILAVINKLPGIADNVRVGFGTPNKAGLYAVTAITDNKNYETGVGVGALLVKMHSKGVKLNWNQTISGGKMTQAEAQEFDFGVTLSYNGDTTIAQDNIHFLYTGFTSKFKPYTSTTKAPTEPGLYTVTVVTLGGNYQAAPITRTFRITK